MDRAHRTVKNAVSPKEMNEQLKWFEIGKIGRHLAS